MIQKEKLLIKDENKNSFEYWIFIQVKSLHSVNSLWEWRNHSFPEKLHKLSANMT